MFYFQNENLPTTKSVNIAIGLMWLISIVLTVLLLFISFNMAAFAMMPITFITSLVAIILFQCKYKYSATSESEEELQRCVSESILVVSYPSLIASVFDLIILLCDYYGFF